MSERVYGCGIGNSTLEVVRDMQKIKFALTRGSIIIITKRDYHGSTKLGCAILFGYIFYTLYKPDLENKGSDASIK